MNMKIVGYLKSMKVLVAIGFSLLSLLSTHSVMALALSQTPLFLAQPVRPIVMLNMSNDHQLFFKAYDDYSDLDGDGIADTSYVNSYEYYGYFDSGKCYSYNSGVFSPSGWADNHYCDGKWSGNFLNWSTMTRIDTVRKILYGGKRSKDTESETVLERAMLTQDAHSYAKYYNGSDLSKLTPYSVTTGQSETANTGITMCNTTNPSSRVYSQNVNSPPLMQVARGNYSLWASNERWQCRWGTASNDNNSAITEIYAHSASPSTNVRLGDYTVRVKACDPDYVNETNDENCKGYVNGNLKPTGLLQAYGEDDSILFGLLTGSYSRNKSGGVLRKNVGSMTDEINSNGTFKTPDNGESIIETLDSLKIYGYNFSDGIYNDGDSCPWALASFNDGRCSNWGNPQSEIYLESLRYLAGLSPSFNTDDSGRISGLRTASWVDPIDNDNYCSPLSVIQFNASTSSYDGDALGGAAGIGVSSLDALTDKVGAGEGISGGSYFIGSNGSDNNQLCTPKTIGSLSQAEGTCPDAPRLEGTYQIAGLAYHARTKGIADDRETVQTFGVALAPAVPKAVVPVPGSNGRSVTILPACRNLQMSPDANCAIVDFKIIKQESVGGVNSGSLYVNWEDSEQGGDFDQDMWGLIKYEVTSDNVTVTTQVVAQSSGDPMGFGYIISGTQSDGFHVHSGINNFTYTSAYPDITACTNVNGSRCTCRNSGTQGQCDNWQSFARSQTFELGLSTAQTLEQPLYYAAKWGGFDTDNGTVDVPDVSAEPSTYFYATDPRELEESLDKALQLVAEGAGSASSVATNSTRLGTDTYVYQALFNSANWSGDLKAIKLTDSGGIGGAEWTASAQIPSTRRIFTYDGTEGVEFEWGNLTPGQQTALNGEDGAGQQRVNWIEGQNVAGLRARDANEKLGDIINSDPVFAGKKDYGFSKLPAHGHASYAAFAGSKSSETVFVNANDGMMHAFDANTGSELFAYIPSSIYEKLKSITDSNYGSSVNPHQYLVDGQIFVGDAYFWGKWRTLLVGALGAGGKGLFVLDVTDPAGFDPDTDVLAELTSAEMGNIMGKPVIAPMANGNWAIVVGNGYNSLNSKAQLIVAELSPSSKAINVQYVDTGVGGDNGLAEASLSVYADGTIKSAYAGDLKGNMWRFDLDGTYSVSRLFAAGVSKPITGAPVLGLNQQRVDEEGSPATMVYFGTGRYLSGSDLANTDVQSFYGIADLGDEVNEADLFTKKITAEGGGTRSVFEGDDPDVTPLLDWESHSGWGLDFDTQAGERVVTKPLLVFDRVIFPTIVPTPNPCDYGGNSWIMELIGVGDLYIGHSVLDEKGLENETLVSLSDLILGQDSDSGVIIKQNSDGTLEPIEADVPMGAFGRQSWRQLQ